MSSYLLDELDRYGVAVRGRTVPAGARWLAPAAIAGLAVCVSTFPSSHGPAFRGALPVIGVLSAAMVVGLQVPSATVRVLSWRPLTWLGRISYGVYLSHALFIWVAAWGFGFFFEENLPGLAAWIVEKFRSWSDCGGDVESVFTKDEMLANISLYWFTGAIGSSFWPYYARMHGPWPVPEGATVDVPVGYTQFPREILRPPRSLAARTFADIRRWSVMPRGGHFAAMEEPGLFVEDVRDWARAT